MENWTFLALQEITHKNLPADTLVWSRWYEEHGSEKMAAFERLGWWQVRGDEYERSSPAAPPQEF
jgi:hypothetical protein